MNSNKVPESVVKMKEDSKAFIVLSGTRVRIVDFGSGRISSYQVELLEDLELYPQKSAWVPEEWVTKDKLKLELEKLSPSKEFVKDKKSTESSKGSSLPNVANADDKDPYSIGWFFGKRFAQDHTSYQLPRAKLLCKELWNQLFGDLSDAPENDKFMLISGCIDGYKHEWDE